MIFTILKGPFRYHASGQQILDANNNVVINLAAWHVLQHVPEGLRLNEEWGQAVAYALTTEAYRRANSDVVFEKTGYMLNETYRFKVTDLKFKPGCE